MKYKKKKISNLKLTLNILSYLFYKLINLVCSCLMFKKKFFFRRIESSINFNYTKKNYFQLILYNLKINILRYYKIDNIHIDNISSSERYFFSTKTDFLKKNYFFVRKDNLKKYIHLNPLINRCDAIIHLGSSVSKGCFFLAKRFPYKKFYQIDLNRNITLLNRIQYSNLNNVYSYQLSINKTPLFLSKIKEKRFFVYSDVSAMYLPNKKIEHFLKKLNKIKHTIIVFMEPFKFDDRSMFFFNNPLIFEKNYIKIIKKSGFMHHKIFDKVYKASTVTVGKNF